MSDFWYVTVVCPFLAVYMRLSQYAMIDNDKTLLHSKYDLGDVFHRYDSY